MKEFKLHGIYFSGLLRIYEVIRQNVTLFPVRNMMKLVRTYSVHPLRGGGTTSASCVVYGPSGQKVVRLGQLLL